MEGSSFSCPRTFVQPGKLFSHNSSCFLMGCVKLGDKWHQNHTHAENHLQNEWKLAIQMQKKIIKDIKDMICLCIVCRSKEYQSVKHHKTAVQVRVKACSSPWRNRSVLLWLRVTHIDKGNFQDKLQSLLCAFSKLKTNWFCVKYSFMPWLEVNQVKM